jgi:hypothetical protein
VKKIGLRRRRAGVGESHDADVGIGGDQSDEEKGNVHDCYGVAACFSTPAR